MDPFSTGFQASLLANGLTTVLNYLGKRSIKEINKKRGLLETVSRDVSLISIVQKSTADVAKSLKGADPKKVERLKAFLVSPDVDAIVRQIYATNFTPPRTPTLTTHLRNEFRACFQLHVPNPPQGLSDAAGIFFDALLNSCDRALEVAIDRGFLSAHEAKSAARTRLITDELTAIKAKLRFLLRKSQPDVREIEEYESKLRSQVANRHAHIVPPHFDARRRIPIDDLFVAPEIATLNPSKQLRLVETKFTLQNLMSFLYQAVVLGNPGSGKSTLATKICHDVALNYAERPLGGRRVTPVLIVLREYGSAKKERATSILQFIEEVSNTIYQIAAPKNAVEYLLRNGRLFIVFDGLDELLDTSYRQQVSEDVESFCALYPSVPILVTSREVGYEQAPLNPQIFETLRVEPFDSQRTETYVFKWFATDRELSKPQQEKKAKAFLKESRSVPDLRTNPLMLALMCNIYRGENYIPRNRPDVYEKCAIMLFEKWDKGRGIQVPLPFETLLRPAMMYLAHWIYGDDAFQGGVTEKALIERSTEYLCPRRYEDPDDARQAATNFIEFCTGRAWVFTDTGTTREGERLFQFTHRTFLEYFTGAYLVRTNPTPHELMRTLIPRIAAREWDVVAQLSFQIQSKQIEGAADALLKKLLRSASSKRRGVKTQASVLSFACRALQFLVPSPLLTREVVTQSVEFAIMLGSLHLQKTDAAKSRHRVVSSRDPVEIIGALLRTADENKAPVAKQLEKELTENLARADQSCAIVALVLALLLPKLVYFVKRLEYYYDDDRSLEEYWHQLREDIIAKQLNIVHTVCQLDPLVSLIALHEGHLDVKTMVQWHGVRSLFLPGRLAAFDDTEIPSLIPFFIMTRIIEEKDKELGFWEPQLKEIAAILLATSPPWLDHHDAEDIKRYYFRALSYRWHLGRRSRSRATATGALAFLAFVSVALGFELATDSKDFVKELFSEGKGFWPSAFYHVLLARTDDTSEVEGKTKLTRFGFSRKQMSLITDWMAGRVSFVI